MGSTDGPHGGGGRAAAILDAILPVALPEPEDARPLCLAARPGAGGSFFRPSWFMAERLAADCTLKGGQLRLPSTGDFLE